MQYFFFLLNADIINKCLTFFKNLRLDLSKLRRQTSETMDMTCYRKERIIRFQQFLTFSSSCFLLYLLKWLVTIISEFTTNLTCIMCHIFYIYKFFTRFIHYLNQCNIVYTIHTFSSAITVSHFWHIDIFDEVITFNTCSNKWKTLKKRNWITELSTFNNHLTYWYTKIFTLIRHTISESLVKVQYSRHECSSIMY